MNSPTKQIVIDDKASGSSVSFAVSAGKTSEFGHESLINIIEVYKVKKAN